MNPRPLVLSSDATPPTPEANAPRVDFIELAARLQADICYAGRGSGLVPRVERATALDLRQAWHASRRPDVGLFFSLSEKVALPLALLPRRSRAPHVLIAHYLTSPRKRALQKRTGYLFRFDKVIVLCRFQEQYLLSEVGLPPEKVRLVWDKVDHRFWTPGTPEQIVPNLVLSVGRERRDYETLVQVARSLPDLTFTIVASSPWSKGTDNTGRDIPPNVQMRRGLPWTELRDLYRQAACVVVPLQAGCEYAAGVNGVLEAMAMRKPLVVTRTPGIADYLDEGQNGLWTSAGDAEALNANLSKLLTDLPTATRLAQSARATIDAGRNLDSYLNALVAVAREAAPTLTVAAANEKEPLAV